MNQSLQNHNCHPAPFTVFTGPTWPPALSLVPPAFPTLHMREAAYYMRAGTAEDAGFFLSGAKKKVTHRRFIGRGKTKICEKGAELFPKKSSKHTQNGILHVDHLKRPEKFHCYAPRAIAPMDFHLAALSPPIGPRCRTGNDCCRTSAIGAAGQGFTLVSSHKKFRM